MQRNPFQRLTPGGQISARQFNEAMESVEELRRMRGDDEAGVTWTGATPGVTSNRRTVLTIRITGGNNPYSWVLVQQLDEAGGQEWTAEDNIAGTATTLPAYEISDNKNVPIGAIVEAEYDAAIEQFSFSYDAIGVNDLADKLNQLPDELPTETADIVMQFFLTLSTAQLTALQVLIGGGVSIATPDLSYYRKQNISDIDPITRMLPAAAVANCGSLVNITATANQIFATPFVLARETAINGLGFHQMSAVIGAKARCAIYASASASDPTPDALQLQTGTIDAGTGAVPKIVAVSGATTLSPGLYWGCFNANSAASTLAIRAFPREYLFNLLGYFNLGGVGGINGEPHVGWSVSHSFGADGEFPATFPAGSIITSSIDDWPAVFFTTGTYP